MKSKENTQNAKFSMKMVKCKIMHRMELNHRNSENPIIEPIMNTLWVFGAMIAMLKRDGMQYFKLPC